MSDRDLQLVLLMRLVRVALIYVFFFLREGIPIGTGKNLKVLDLHISNRKLKVDLQSRLNFAIHPLVKFWPC